MRHFLPSDPRYWRECQCGTGCGLKFARTMANRSRRFHHECEAGKARKLASKQPLINRARAQLKASRTPEEWVEYRRAAQAARNKKHSDTIKAKRALREATGGPMTADGSRERRGGYCPECMNLSHRRAQPVCKECLQPFAEEINAERFEPQRSSTTEWNN